MNLPFTDIRQVLSLHNKVSPEKIFLTVISENGREELSYGEFSARSHQTANFLQEDLRIQPGDVVAILDDQPGDTAVLLIACWLIGAIVVSLPAVPNDLVVHQLAQSWAKRVFIRSYYLPAWQRYMHDEPVAAVRESWNKLTLIQLGGEPTADYQHFHTLVRSMPNTFFNEHPEPTLDSLAALFPIKNEVLFKPMTQGQLLDSAQSLAAVQTITGNQRLINYLPLSGQIAPQLSVDVAVNILLTTLLVGGSLVISTTLEPQSFWREIAASRLHIACLSTAHIAQLMAYAREQQAAGKPIYGEGVYQQDIKQLRHIYCPDAKSKDDLIKQFTAMFPFPIVTNNG